MTSDRPQALLEFASKALRDSKIVPVPASADASFRSYWRVRSHGTSYIVMDAPPQQEDVRPWLDIARRLSLAGINAPQVFARDLAQGFILMSDLGTRLYLPELNSNSADRLYGDAMNALYAMQTRLDASGLPLYSESMLMTELELFPEWFLKRHLGLSIACEEWDVIESSFRHLISSALEQPTTFVHRDFHSRNLLITEGVSPGVIDFQGAVLGPLTYDLVSLLRDCYIEWPTRRVELWAGEFRDRLIDARRIDHREKRWQRWFDWMGLQRHLKVLGIFCRLCYRDGKPSYLNDLPLVLRYVLEFSDRYPQLAPFGQWLEKKTRDRDITRPRP